jgi:hypothetical protein
LAVLCASCLALAAGIFKQEAPTPPPPIPTPPAARVDLLAPEPRTAPEAFLDRQPALAPAAPDALEQAPNPPEQTTENQGGGSYIGSLESVGLTKLTVEDLISLKVQGVTADYVRQVKAAGFDPSVRDLIGMKVQGVTPEYIHDIHAAGLKPSVGDLVGMKVQGVTPEFVRALQSAGLGDLEMRDFISAKVQGITPEFIEKVRGHGFKNLTFRQLISLKVAEVF